MIISPYILSKIKGKAFSTDTTLGCQPALEITPKAFKPIYVIAFTITIFLLSMLNDPVDIAFGSNASITFPGIRTDYGTTSNSLTYQGKQRFGFSIGNHLSPYLTISAQDTKHGSFLSASSSLGLDCLLALPFVFPLAAYIGLIYLYNAAKDVGDILSHSFSYVKQCSQNTLTLNARFLCNTLSRKTLQKRHHYHSPFRCLQSEGQTVGLPLIFTSDTTTLLSPNYIAFAIRTSRTFMSLCHATTLS